MKVFEEKNCSSCGKSFGCGPALGQQNCWCDQLPRVSLVAAADQDCLCPACLPAAIAKLKSNATGGGAETAPVTDGQSLNSLVAGEDYYFEGAAMVFTARYHLRRGYCCENNCRHCPYDLKQSAG